MESRKINIQHNLTSSRSSKPAPRRPKREVFSVHGSAGAVLVFEEKAWKENLK